MFSCMHLHVFLYSKDTVFDMSSRVLIYVHIMASTVRCSLYVVVSVLLCK